MRSLTIEPMRVERIAQAFPLVQLVRPHLSRDEWQSYAERILSEADAGIALLTDARDLILGLFVWRVGLDPDHGRTLNCEDFVAADIVDPQRVAEALADGLEETARAQNCTAVHTCISATSGGGARRLVDCLRGLGHHMESFQLCKTLSSVA